MISYVNRQLLRAVRSFLLFGICTINGEEFSARQHNAAQLAPRSVFHEVHRSLGQHSRGHLYLPEVLNKWTPPPPCRPQTFKSNLSTFKVWPYNCETLNIDGRLEELPCVAASNFVDIVCLQGTCSNDDEEHLSEAGYLTIPCSKSSSKAHDGYLIAVSLKRFRSESVVCRHVWQLGRIQGIRLKQGSGRDEVDFYVLNGYAPMELPSSASEDLAAAKAALEESKDKFWSSLDTAYRCIPRRCSLVGCIWMAMQMWVRMLLLSGVLAPRP